MKELSSALVERNSSSVSLKISSTALLTDLISVFAERREQVAFSMAIGKTGPWQEVILTLSMGTARMKDI